MASETLGDNADIVMGQSPPGSSVSASPNGLPLLNGPTEFGSHHPTPVQFTTDVRKRAFPRDILFCVRGSTTGRMNWADQEYAIGRGIAAIRHRKISTLQPLVRAVIENGLEGLLAQATGSTFPNVSASQLSTLPYPTLEEAEQRAIAHILGSLDDKIELNRKMNETLEAMARAIFKSWFVDFDPVRARRGDPMWSPTKGADTKICPYMTTEILNLFPDSFEDSELGPIPKGWEIKTIGEAVEFAYGKALKASNRKPGNVPVFGSNGPVGLHSEALVKGPGIVIGRKGNPGIVTWSSKDFFPIDTTFYVKQTGSIKSLNYLFYALKDQDLSSLSADSAVPGLNRNIAYMNSILVPSEKALSAFDEQIVPLFKKIDANDDESVTLASLRDVLLPKLISGELRVPDAEKFVEEAAL